MRLEELRLQHFSQRGLNMLGHVFGGGDVRILLSDRSLHPLTVILESRTIMLDPKMAGVFDLALGVRLLKQRHLRAKGDLTEEQTEKHDRKLSLRVRKRLAGECRAELTREFPGIRRLTGYYQHPHDEFRGLQVTTRSGKLKPMPKPERGPTETPSGPRPPAGGSRVPISLTNVEYTAIPGVDISGMEDDFDWLLEALNAGSIPLHHLPQLEELPFVRIPFRYCTQGNFEAMRWLEEELASEETQQSIRDFMKCIMQKSEVRDERSSRGRRTTSGTRLDSTRLVDAVLGARSGIEPRIFRRRLSTIEPVFDPSEHVTVMAIDLSDVWHRPWDVDRFLTILVTTYQRLEVDTAIVGYAGRLVRLDNGQEVYLHFVTQIKATDEPWEESTWSRLVNTIRTPLKFPGEPAYFHPVGLQDIARTLEEIEREQTHSYRTIVWWARRWMHGDYDRPEFLMRAADSVDFQMAELKRGQDGTLDTLGSFLPKRLCNHGRPGEYLASVEVPTHEE